MVISILKARTPEKYSEIGDILYELEILDKNDSKLLKSMAGLRNILVHMYAHIDREKIHEASRKLIHDAPRISSTIYERLKNKEIDPEKDDKLDEIIVKLRKVLEKRVEAAYLFGGRAKGYILKGDYDIAVIMPENYSLFDLGLLQIDIARTLKVDEEKIDIVCLNNASPRLILDALNGIPIIENPVKTMELKVKAMRNLLDIKSSKFWKTSLNSK